MTHYADFTARQWSELSLKSPGLVQEPDKQIGNPTECKYCPEETAPAKTREVGGLSRESCTEAEVEGWPGVADTAAERSLGKCGKRLAEGPVCAERKQTPGLLPPSTQGGETSISYLKYHSEPRSSNWMVAS